MCGFLLQVAPWCLQDATFVGNEYLAPESEINNPTSAISEEELEEQVPILLLCDSCHEKLEVFPLPKVQ